MGLRRGGPILQDPAELDTDSPAITQGRGWKSQRLPLQYAEKINTARSGMPKAGGEKTVTPEPNAEETIRGFIIGGIRRRYGRRGVIVFACLVVVIGLWWKWKDVKEVPGIASLVAYFTEKSLPTAVPGKFNIAIAHLVGDDDKHHNEELIRESLTEQFPSFVTLSFDRLIAPEEANSERSEHGGHERARIFLAASGADVLIWGKILEHDGKSLPKLYWTLAKDVGRLPSAARYQMTETLGLPVIFWQDLTSVLGLLVATTDTELSSQKGRYSADKLEPFIERVRALIGDSKTEQWNSSTRAQVQVILADALST
jgi:hypothetical protein